LAGRAGERDHIADVLDACCHHHEALEAETEAAVGHGAVLAELAVPPVCLLLQLAVLDAAI
jgi:hypothetical protein